MPGKAIDGPRLVTNPASIRKLVFKMNRKMLADQRDLQRRVPGYEFGMFFACPPMETQQRLYRENSTGFEVCSMCCTTYMSFASLYATAYFYL